MAAKAKFLLVLLCCLLSANIAKGSTLSRCLNACALGTKYIQAFCRSIWFKPPQVRALCWANQFAGVAACSGFCYSAFGKKK